MTTALTLIFLAGLAEFLKDLSSEGKLKGYWDKNHRPQVWAMRRGGYDVTGEVIIHDPEWTQPLYPEENELWWKVHWLQGPMIRLPRNVTVPSLHILSGKSKHITLFNWDWVPVWIRQYLAFRDGWHLLKFFSLNLFAVGVVLLAGLPWWWFIVIRALFSTPETLGRIIYNKLK